MNKAILIRKSDDGVQTLGTIACSRTTDERIFSCFDLDLSWKDNKTNISCIPKGTYNCSIRPFYDTTQYEVLDVPGRTGIFIHTGNYYHDVLGGMILGRTEADINCA